MNIFALVEKVNAAGLIKPSRLKDIKSSARQYALILGFDNPNLCGESAYVLPKIERDELILTHLKDASAIKLRNLKNNLNFLFKQAEDLHIIRIKQVTALERCGALNRTSGIKMPKLITNHEHDTSPYFLHYEDWPSELQQDYDQWKQWVSGGFVKGRPSKRKLRPASIQIQLRQFQSFFGYVRNIRSVEHLHLRMVTDPILISDFVQWYVNVRCAGRVSRTISMAVSMMSALARNYYSDPAAAQSIYSIRQELGEPEPVRDKESRMVSVADLISAGITEFPKKSEMSPYCNSRRIANRAGRAVAIMLLAARPLRNKNYRECLIGSHLIKDARDKWCLHFTGHSTSASLKRERRNGKTNIYHMEVPDFIVPYLEEYLSFWRPFIASSDHSDLLFITISGTPYRDADDFNFWIQRGLYKWLGKRINPHLIRDIVATEIINETGNYVAAAALLNDEPATMFKHYWHLQQQKAADTADAWIAKKMNVV